MRCANAYDAKSIMLYYIDFVIDFKLRRYSNESQLYYSRCPIGIPNEDKGSDQKKSVLKIEFVFLLNSFVYLCPPFLISYF